MGRTKVFLDIRIDGLLLGPIIFELYNDVVPRTTDNFQRFCTMENGVGYKGCRIFKIFKDSYCQSGDFINNDGRGGSSIFGDVFEDENFIIKHNKPGLLSMANSGPDTNASQFFITFAAYPQFNDKHVVFGEVIDGAHIVKTIENCGQENGLPKSDVMISDCGIWRA